MKKAKNRLMLYTMLSVFVLLTVLLGVINGTNFTMAADDADTLTLILANQHGAFGLDQGMFNKGGRRNMGPMGPSSVETQSSLRYFTFAFDDEGNAEKIEFKLSAIDESEAESWARSLMNSSKGWTRGTYRFRVYEDRGKTFVTVIDQGREMLSCYRILIISACGEVIGLILSYLFLRYAYGKLFEPLEDADRKQREFISGMEREFNLPLTIVSANTELIERSGDFREETGAIRRQIKQMSELLKRLSGFALFEKGGTKQEVNLSEMLSEEIDSQSANFAERSISISSDISPDLTLRADIQAIKKLVGEIVENALKFSQSKASFSLKREGDRLTLESQNDATLKDGSCDQVFDRFTKLENAADSTDPGLGLSAVKDIAASLSGRVSARVDDGTFKLRVSL